MAKKPPYTIPYDPKFLGEQFTVSLPSTCCKGKLVEAGKVFDYIHFSLVMHQDRRTALYTAHNIDYAQKNSASGGSWDIDARMSAAAQIDNTAYKHNDWDRGHLVRRDAVVWGNQQRAQDASRATYFYTNAALQHKDFNQSNSRWLGLENWILHKAGSHANRLCVFTGPIYTEVDELTNRNYTIPSAFWKIVVLKDPTADGEDLSAIAFLMKQNENWRSGGNRALTNLQPYHVSIAEIEAYTGLNFGEIAELDEFDWRQVRFRNRALMPAIPINGPDDIIFSGNQRRAQGIRAMRTYTSDSQFPIVAERAIATKAADHDCGCKGRKMDLEKEIIALKKQTTALCEIIETLMENNQGNFSKEAMITLGLMRPRIIGGQMVAAGEFPECAAVGDDWGYFCTGILVHPRVVLTAAHCIDPTVTKVFLKARQITDTNGGEVIEVLDTFVHPDYSEHRIPQHDIAVLILKEAATVAPIEIATKAEVLADDSLILVGFGSDDPNGISGFGTKRRVDVPLTVNDTPAALFHNQQTHRYDAAYEFHGGRVRSGEDSCNGDSGGPAYIKIGNVTKVAGLTSRAAHSSTLNCGDGGIYTLVDAYAHWLFEVTDGKIGQARAADDDATTTVGGLYISAAFPNPDGKEAGNEWIEVTNSSAAIIDLGNYIIQDRQGGKLALTGQLASGDTLRIVLPEDSAVKLGNGGDDILLFLGETVVHEVSYHKAKRETIILFDPPADFPDNDDHDDDNNNDADGEGEEEEEEQEEENPCAGCGGDHDDCNQPIDPAFTPGAIRC